MACSSTVAGIRNFDPRLSMLRVYEHLTGVVIAGVMSDDILAKFNKR